MGKLDIEPLGRTALSHKRPANFDRFWFGCCYYPEHWDQKTRELDPDRMREAGMNVVRMAEFAWSVIEPREGEFTFDFFDEQIERLGKHGIHTIMCTPTATPPRWLTSKYPAMLRVDGNGVPLQHGSRQHCCHANPVFRRYSRRITREMARHFASNPFVIGWQTDNEFNCHFSECHCSACQEGFREFLRARYRDIKTLNKAWGTVFWSQTYDSFEQITTPRPRPTHMNPAHQLDYYRFIAHYVAVFQHDQVEEIRKANPDWFVMHNGVFGHIDYRGLFTKDLDVLGYDVYPQFQYDSRYRATTQAFNLDRARAWSGNFIVPEQQSGPGGQAPYFHDHPEPGEIRRMAYTSIARGADSLLFFRWRTCRFGAEEYWCGVLDHDNRPRRRYDEVKQIGAELKFVGKEILGTSVRVDVAVAAADITNIEAHRTISMGLPSPENIAERIHYYFNTNGYAVGCVHPSDDLSSVKLYFIPHWVIVDPNWVRPLKEFVEDGGILVVGARTATRDIHNNVIDETPPGILTELCGTTVEEYSRQNDTGNRPICLEIGGRKIVSQHWYEALEPDNSQVVSRWVDRHLAGKPAITCNRIGDGKVYYVGTYLTDEVISALASLVLEDSGVRPILEEIPNGLSVVARENADKIIWFLINTTDETLSIEKTPTGTNLMTGKLVRGTIDIAPRDVVVVRESKKT